MGMEIPENIRQIRKIPLFGNLPDDVLKIIDRILVRREFNRGGHIFSEGSESTGFYIVINGRVKVYKLSADGKEQILHIVKQNELLGAVSAFAGGPYPAHADAMEKTEALYFPRDEFLELVKTEPSVVMNMITNLAFRLHMFTRMIEDLSLKEVPGRLAAYLLYLCDQHGCSDSVEIDITKGQLASLLGTIPETLSRILKKMSERDILQVSGRTIKLLDREALQHIVDGEKLAV